MLLHGVLGKSKTVSLLHVQPPSLLHVQPPSLFTPALSARFSPVHQFVCVSYSMYKYIHAHTRSVPPPLAIMRLRTRSAAVRHWRDLSLSTYERDLVTNEKV